VGRLLRGGLGPLAHREFRLLFAGQVVSLAGSALAPVALAFAIFDLTGSASDLGLVLAAAWLPQVAFVLVGGVLADRLPRSLILVGSNLTSGAAQAVVAVLLLTGNAELWHLLLTQVVRGSATAFFFPAIQSVVPDTVPATQLQQANAVIRLSFSVTTILGAAVGGGLVAAAGPGWAFAFDAATYFASAAILAGMRRGGTAAVGERKLFRELADGWSEFRSRTWVWVFVAGASVVNLVWTGASGVLAPLVSKESLGGPEAFGALIAGESVGLLIGGLIALRWRPQRPLLVAGLTGFGLPVFLAALALPAPLPLAVLAAVPAGIGLELGNVLWLTALQQHIPRDRLARVTSYDALGSFVFIPIGFAVAGPVAEATSASTALWGAAAVSVAMTLAVLASADVRNLRRRVDQADEAEAETRSIAVS
jgi:MFS family permease